MPLWGHCSTVLVGVDLPRGTNVHRDVILTVRLLVHVLYSVDHHIVLDCFFEGHGAPSWHLRYCALLNRGFLLDTDSAYECCLVARASQVETDLGGLGHLVFLPELVYEQIRIFFVNRATFLNYVDKLIDKLVLWVFLLVLALVLTFTIPTGLVHGNLLVLLDVLRVGRLVEQNVCLSFKGEHLLCRFPRTVAHVIVARSEQMLSLAHLNHFLL